MKALKHLIISIIVIAILFLIAGCEGYKESHYTVNGVITSIDGNLITVETIGNNEIWQFTGSDYKVNQTVKIIFYDNHTIDNIYDDEIIDVK